MADGCLTSILGIFLGNNSNEHHRKSKVYPYRVRDDFLSDAEASFYRVLKVVVANQAIIFSKVGLWDIFYVAQPNQNPGAKPHIDRKHVDFLLCDLETLCPVVAIELDDSSHQKAARKVRDAEVDLVFETAGLPLLHIPAQRGYNTNELVGHLAPYLGVTNQPPVQRSSPPVSVNEDTPLCPKCGDPMVIRVAQRGQYQGQKFYACRNYPRCKSTIPIKE